MISNPEHQPLQWAGKSQNSLGASEIRFLDILLFIRKYIRFLMIATVGATFFGFVFTYSQTKKYEAKTTLLPEYSVPGRGSFSLLGSGSNGEGAEKLRPELYPLIMQSSPFGTYLLRQPVVDQQNKPYKTLLDFLKANRKPGFLAGLIPSSAPKQAGKQVKLPRGSRVLFYSPEQQSNIYQVLSLLSTEVDAKTEIIEISAETIDPFVSAIVIQAATKYLVNYVDDYRATKARQRARILEERVKESKSRMKSAEYALQNYRDQNRNIFSNMAKIQQQRLQAEYVLAESLYSDLVRRYEQAKISVKEERPVFKVLQPVKVPLSKSSPKRLRTGLIFGFLGGFFSVVYLLVFREKVVQKVLANR